MPKFETFQVFCFTFTPGTIVGNLYMRLQVCIIVSETMNLATKKAKNLHTPKFQVFRYQSSIKNDL